jgi:CspA family cold shock protein
MPAETNAVPMEGMVKWFNGEKGYGFVTAPGLEKDVFLHVKQLRASGIQGAMTDGEAIKFVCNTGPKGFFATSITRVNGTAPVQA